MSGTNGNGRLLDRLRRDVGRYFSLDSETGSPGLREKLFLLATRHGLKATAVYRFGAWVNQEVQAPPLRYPLKLLYYTLDEVTSALWGMHIDEGADIGGGLYVPHPNGVLIGPSRMGTDCNVAAGVTIGQRADGRGGGVPTLGDRVWIGTGSVLFGRIAIGDGATIGPLTLVGRNLPPRCLVSGNPMQVLSRDKDNHREIYGAHGAKAPAPGRGKPS